MGWGPPHYERCGPWAAPGNSDGAVGWGRRHSRGGAGPGLAPGNSGRRRWGWGPPLRRCGPWAAPAALIGRVGAHSALQRCGPGLTPATLMGGGLGGWAAAPQLGVSVCWSGRVLAVWAGGSRGGPRRVGASCWPGPLATCPAPPQAGPPIRAAPEGEDDKPLPPPSPGSGTRWPRSLGGMMGPLRDQEGQGGEAGGPGELQAPCHTSPKRPLPAHCSCAELPAWNPQNTSLPKGAAPGRGRVISGSLLEGPQVGSTRGVWSLVCTPFHQPHVLTPSCVCSADGTPFDSFAPRTCWKSWLPPVP